MARKSSKSIKPFELNFEVVLIIVLIIVAICLVCFLNRKYRGVEGFYTTQAGTTTAKDKDKKELHFFYADWCGYSTKYIEAESNGLAALKDALKDALEDTPMNVSDVLKDYNVDRGEGKKHAKTSGVTKLPTFYTFTNGKYDTVQQFKDAGLGTETVNTALVNWLTG